MTRPLVLLARAAALSTAALAVGVLGAGSAQADTTRCIGAVDTPGAFACYTSPRTDHIGLDKSQLADVPVVCYGLGCTAPVLNVYVPSDQVGGRFTAVFYNGKTYTVYRPTSAQPYVIASGGSFTPAEQAQVLALSTALDAVGA
jgi:hypothetical protein